MLLQNGESFLPVSANVLEINVNIFSLEKGCISKRNQNMEQKQLFLSMLDLFLQLFRYIVALCLQVFPMFAYNCGAMWQIFMNSRILSFWE